jgi:NADH-quinone oxidoreductase subunit A
MFAVYFPIVLMVIVGFGFALLFLALSAWMGSRRGTPQKETTYESGVEPVGNARQRFSVKFYMVAVSFIIFDIEVVFLYPWAVQAGVLGWIPFAAMMIFILVLFAGYFYELKKGGFEWD